MSHGLPDNFIRPEVRKTSDLPFHNDRAPGTRRVFIEKALYPRSNLYVMVRTARDVREDQPRYVESHAHRVSSTYILLGDGEGLEGLKAEVVLDGRTYVVGSPVTVFIDAGVVHSYRLIEGAGHFIHAVLEGNYNASLQYQPAEMVGEAI